MLSAPEMSVGAFPTHSTLNSLLVTLARQLFHFDGIGIRQ
jgi:hypothetical protein